MKYLSVKILCLRIPTDKFEFFDTTNTGSLSLFFSGFNLRSSVNKVERQIKSLAATRNSKKSERSLNEDIYDFISNKSLRPRDTALEQILLLPELCAILLDFDNKELHKHKLGLALACLFLPSRSVDKVQSAIFWKVPRNHLIDRNIFEKIYR